MQNRRNEPQCERVGQKEGDKLKGIHFVFRLPHPDLRGLISNYFWMFTPNSFVGVDAAKLCNGPLSMIIFSDDIKWELSCGANQYAIRSPGVIGGQVTVPAVSKINESSWTLSIELFPFAMNILLGVSAHELEEQFVSLNDLPAASLDTFVDRIRHLKTVDEQLQALDDYFLDQLSRHKKAKEKMSFYCQCMKPLYDSSGTVLIRDLQKQSGLSKRQFERNFKEQVGISASVMRRMVRSNSALIGLVENKSVGEILYDHKYFDQAHFIRDIKWYTGMTPKTFQTRGKDNLFRIAHTSYISRYDDLISETLSKR